jgi:hypothetical protein
MQQFCNCRNRSIVPEMGKLVDLLAMVDRLIQDEFSLFQVVRGVAHTYSLPHGTYH